MESFVWSLLIVIICLICSLPFTYNFVSKRNRFITKLNKLGLQETDEGSITKFEGTPKSIDVFFPSDPEENTRSSKNPGFMYAAASTTMLLPNAAIGAFYYFVYKRRIRYQRRIYNPTQLKLLEQIEKSEGDCFHLKEVIKKEFFPS